MGPENREVKACKWESVKAEENLQHSGEKAFELFWGSERDPIRSLARVGKPGDTVSSRRQG